ncbi:MAG: polysaccharide deacetylase family protein [Acidobacteriia bacterium]|nr:polysaccharide deacetylase family protein [Terriglobia bacterium]
MQEQTLRPSAYNPERGPAQAHGTSPAEFQFHVLLFTQSASPHMVQLLNAISESSEVCMHVLFERRCSADRNWGIHEPRCSFSYLPRSLFSQLRLLSSLVSNRRWDCVVVSASYWSPLSWYLRVLCDRRGLPLVFHNEMPNLAAGVVARLFKLFALRCFIRRATSLWGTGRHAEVFYRSLAASQQTTASVPYFIDLSPFSDLPEAEPSSIFRILFCGRLDENKNLVKAVRACESLTFPWTLDVFGRGPLCDWICHRAKADPRIRYHGEVSYDTRHSMFCDRDVLILPSRHDGWGMVVLEALASGVPVIASNAVASAWEFISFDGSNGAMCPPDDTPALSMHLTRLQRQAQRFPAMRAAARASVAHHTPRRGAEVFVDSLYHSLVGGLEDSSQRTAAAGASYTYFSGAERGLKSVRWRLKVAVTTSMLRGHHAPPAGLFVALYHFVLPNMLGRFAEHLAYFRDNFEIVPLAQVCHARVAAGKPMLALTFDDCFLESATTACDALHKRGIPGTFFLPTGTFLSEDRHWNLYLKRRFHLDVAFSRPTPDLVRDLCAAGHEIGTHGHAHLSYRRMSSSEALRDAMTASAILQSTTGFPPQFMAYPFGDDPRSEVLDHRLREIGIRAAFTTQRGRNSAAADVMRLRRDHFEGDWDLDMVRYFIEK